MTLGFLLKYWKNPSFLFRKFFLFIFSTKNDLELRKYFFKLAFWIHSRFCNFLEVADKFFALGCVRDWRFIWLTVNTSTKKGLMVTAGDTLLLFQRLCKPLSKTPAVIWPTQFCLCHEITQLNNTVFLFLKIYWRKI